MPKRNQATRPKSTTLHLRAAAAAAALAVVTATLLTPHTPRGVTSSAVSVVGVQTAVDAATNLAVLPAPTTTVAPVVVATPTIPPLPAATTARDEPALAEHVAQVSAELDRQTQVHAQAASTLAQAQSALATAELRLRTAQTEAAAAGAPLPVAPSVPAPPQVTTPTGEPIPVTTPALPADPLSTAVPIDDLTTLDIQPATEVTAQVQAIAAGTAAQADLASAQAALVTAAVVEQVTASGLATLHQELTTGQQALTTLPPPDPRWPDGCPTDAPAGTLRNGAATIGIWQLCADSVAAAPTPEAATAIKWALNNLDIPYSQAHRNEAGYADCSSFLARAFSAAGVPLAVPGVNAPTTATYADVDWAVHLSASAALPGDLVEPEAGHIVMVLAHGFIVHTSTDGDVSHVRSAYYGTNPYLTLRIDPAAVSA